VTIFFINFEEILLRTHGNFEEQNEVLQSSIIIIINYFNIIVIIDAHYIVKVKIIITFLTKPSLRNVIRKKM